MIGIMVSSHHDMERFMDRLPAERFGGMHIISVEWAPDELQSSCPAVTIVISQGPLLEVKCK